MKRRRKCQSSGEEEKQKKQKDGRSKFLKAQQNTKKEGINFTFFYYLRC